MPSNVWDVLVRWWRRAAVVAVVATAGAGTPAVAAAPPRAYVVTSSRSASVDVAFGRAVTLDMARTKVSGTGQYAGYYVQPLAGPPDAGYGEMWVASFGHPPFDKVAIPLGGAGSVAGYDVVNKTPGSLDRRLPPGRYRIHALGDAATRVALALRGVAAPRTLRATRPSALAATWRDVTPGAAGQRVPGAVVTDIPVTVGSASSLTFLSYYLVWRGPDLTSTSAVNWCLGPRDVPPRCHAGEPPPEAGVHPYAYGHSERQVQQPTRAARGADLFVSYYNRGSAPAGPRVAHFEVASSAVVDRLVVGVFTLAY